ncbi:MAG: non-canonical purine NTP pyrophosphatase [Candidatus Aenigmarchaeota archaeon]|nr:non-canonical purine NTP pyrophosphatase [Candidatus Aenigmarchaeota archaeon]
MEIVFVTSNPNKVREVEEILGMKVKQVSIDVKEIQSLDVKDVVREKVIEAYKIVNKPVIVEDTGLYIESLNGFPGALIKWVMKTIGNEGICRITTGDRRAVARTYVGYYDGNDLNLFVGEISGRISDVPRGDGFGWDAVFIPDEYEKTFGELGPEIKNKISMRKIAFEKLRNYLKQE